jgi:ATP phosphoribosyltransferase regulatory subunit HisZ
VIAQKVRAAAMAEFDMRMTRARAMNAGKADALAAGLLSIEEAYYFRAWSAYQLDLVRAIQAEGFPDAVSWPSDPISFAEASAPAMAEFDARMAKAEAMTEGKADALAAGTLDSEGYYTLQVWTAYQDDLKRAIARETFPLAVVWPAEPAPYSPPPAPIPVAAPPAPEPAPETPADPA